MSEILTNHGKWHRENLQSNIENTEFKNTICVGTLKKYYTRIPLYRSRDLVYKGDYALNTKPVMLILVLINPSYRVELQSAVIAIRWGSSAAPSSSWDNG